MNPENYIKAAIKSGIKVAESINPYSHGVIDTTAVAQRSLILRDLLNTGERCVISESYGVSKNLLPCTLMNALIAGVSPLSDHWQNELRRKCRCLVFIDQDDKIIFSEQLNNLLCRDEVLVDMDYIANHPKSLQKLLTKKKPMVCIFNTRLDSKSGKRIEVLHKCLSLCRRKDIAVVLFIPEELKANFNNFDTLVKVWKSPKEDLDYIIETTSGLFRESIGPFGIKWSENGWTSRQVEKDTLDQINDRCAKQTMSGIDPNIKL